MGFACDWDIIVFYLTYRVSKLPSSASCIAAMPTLQKPERKNGNRSTDTTRNLESRIVAIEEELQEMRDSIALLKARKANKGKKLLSVNEVRARLQLPAI